MSCDDPHCPPPRKLTAVHRARSPPRDVSSHLQLERLLSTTDRRGVLVVLCAWLIMAISRPATTRTSPYRPSRAPSPSQLYPLLSWFLSLASLLPILFDPSIARLHPPT
ncbi:hypothetical protein FIBSPDRAFT_175367 [Athelia psychrophila]|uniref:Uncharacterized protein n=1 Tax=Athelia psychrophila TaxID=1759441 RepID=A0A166AP12_9AGAM|nr:hypothetical protein FIBSPDRAFT_175367 [Fibularhizoctonia sp. CBS 109695]